MTLQLIRQYALCCNRSQCHRQLGKQLALHQADHLGTVTGALSEFTGNICTYLSIENDGVNNFKGILTVTLYYCLKLHTGFGRYQMEINRSRGSVKVAHNLLCIEEVNSLILCSVSAEGKSSAKGFKGVCNIGS